MTPNEMTNEQLVEAVRKMSHAEAGRFAPILATRLESLAKVVDKLPRTADGVPIVHDGNEEFFDMHGDAVRIVRSGVCGFRWEDRHYALWADEQVYSTREAALAPAAAKK